MRHQNRSFKDQDVRLDYNDYTDCTFENCTLLYAGNSVPVLRGSRIMNCQIIFEDDAIRTVNFMLELARDSKSGALFVVREVLGLDPSKLQAPDAGKDD